MEPYRPYVDQIVLGIIDRGENFLELSTSIKAQLLSIATVDVTFDGRTSPLMVGLQQTTASLAKCYEGSLRKIIYPQIKDFGKGLKNHQLSDDGDLGETDEGAPNYGDGQSLPF